MSGRSSRLASALALCVLAACGRPHIAELDPGVVTEFAKQALYHTPMPGGSVECTREQLVGGATLTYATLKQLGGQKLSTEPEDADWMNPPELDAPAARTLVTGSASPTDRRRAAAELMSAPFFLVYLVDHVAAPLALGNIERRQGFVNARALRYDPHGDVVCRTLFYWYNDDAKSQWAIDKTDGVTVDPAVSQAMRDDLRYQMLKAVSELASPNRKLDKKGMPPKPPG